MLKNDNEKVEESVATIIDEKAEKDSDESSSYGSGSESSEDETSSHYLITSVVSSKLEDS